MLILRKCFIAIKFLGVIIVVGVMSGCSLTPLPDISNAVIEKKSKQLTQMLIDLNKSIDPQEAKDFSLKSLHYAKKLSHNYKIVSPPLWHNILVNIGIKKRGLCYEWSEDMLRYLLQQNYQTLRFFAVGANIGEYFEHNAIVVSAKKESYKEGIVLDAWRNSGNLFFDKVANDKKYEWKNRATLYKSITFKIRH